MKQVSIDKNYWESREDFKNNSDKLAAILNTMHSILDGQMFLGSVFSDIEPIIKAERVKIVKETAARFSDIINMINEFSPDEESIYETAVKICNHYRKSLKSKKGK